MICSLIKHLHEVWFELLANFELVKMYLGGIKLQNISCMRMLYAESISLIMADGRVHACIW